jgi:hypothetical protein
MMLATGCADICRVQCVIYGSQWDVFGMFLEAEWASVFCEWQKPQGSMFA